MKHILGGLCGLFLVACSSPPEPPTTSTGQRSQGIFNGTPVAHAKRPTAVFLNFKLKDGVGSSCTGTLIAPDKVLTAAHCTVCAVEGTAQIMGEGIGLGLSPGEAPPIPHPIVGFFTHPEGFSPTPPDCNLPPEELKIALDTTTVSGSDLGVVVIGAPSAVPPSPVLLSPPLGFSPLQDLFGQQVTIVGRGLEFEGGNDVSVMREGSHDLSRFEPLGGSCSSQDHTGFILEAERQGSEAIIEPGDSGGPMFAVVQGTEQVMGVASRGGGTFSTHTPTFTLRNAKFLRGLLNGGPSLTDSDGDDVPDLFDNCIADANTDQLDRDGDGRGDVCDNCTPSDEKGNLLPLTSFSGPVANPGTFINASQENTNAEAENAQILKANPALLTPAGLVRHITLDDYRRAAGNGAGCFGPGTVVGLLHQQRRGDRCDPVPVAPATPGTKPVDTSDFAGSQALPCVINGYGFGTCSYEAMASFSFKALVDQGPNPGEVGLRHCQCDLPHDTEGERRLNCAAGPFQCAVDASLYQLNHPKWRKLKLDNPDANGESLVPLTFPNGTASIGWDYASDLLTLTGSASLPDKPWKLEDDGSLVNGPKLHGILWSHVVEYKGTSTSKLPDIEGRHVAELASTYGDGDHRFFRVVHWHKFPQYKPAFPWEYCANCRVEPEQKWLEVINEREGMPAYVIAVGPREGRDVTGAVDLSARQLLQAGTHVNASEAAYQLENAAVSRRALVVKDGTAEVVGALSVKGNTLVGEPFKVDTARPLARGERALFTYAGTLDQLFALRQPEGGRVSLEQFSPSAGWSTPRLTGGDLKGPLAATYVSDEQALIVLDRGEGTAVRLVRIGVADGQVKELSARFLDGTYSALSLATSAPGTLLVVAADVRAEGTSAAHVSLTGERTPMTLVDTAALPGERMQGAAVERAGGGALFLVPSVEGGFEPRALGASSFRRVDKPLEGPVFQ